MLQINKFSALGHTLLVFILFVSCQPSVQKKLNMNKLFSDHMVLQQNEDATFWGKYSPNGKITVSGNWNKKNSTSTADENGN